MSTDTAQSLLGPDSALLGLRTAPFGHASREPLTLVDLAAISPELRAGLARVATVWAESRASTPLHECLEMDPRAGKGGVSLSAGGDCRMRFNDSEMEVWDRFNTRALWGDACELYFKLAMRAEGADQAMLGSLAFERDIYRRLTETMIAGRQTPHVVMCACVLVGVMAPDSIGGDPSTMRPSEVTAHARVFRSIGAHADTPRTCDVLLLEKIQGVSLREFSTSLKTNEAAIKAMPELSFQLMYTLSCLQTHQIRHNDLHLRNIYVQELTRPVYIRYTLTTKDRKKVSYDLVSKYVIKLFDFDRAAMKGAENPLLVENGAACMLYGQCNNVSPHGKTDMLQALYSLKDLGGAAANIKKLWDGKDAPFHTFLSDSRVVDYYLPRYGKHMRCYNEDYDGDAAKIEFKKETRDMKMVCDQMPLAVKQLLPSFHRVLDVLKSTCEQVTAGNSPEFYFETEYIEPST